MKTNIVKEDRLLATHISENENFESACLTGNADMIRSIVLSEMEKANLHTKGSNKLKDDIFLILKDKPRVPSYIGQNILAFVWNSRLSGTGLAVAK